MQKILFHSFFQQLKQNSFRVTYWDQSSETYGADDPLFSIHFRNKMNVPEFLKNPGLSFGEAYMAGDIDIEGRIEDVITTAYGNKDKIWSHTLTKLPKFKLSMGKQKENVQYHYDLGNDFYQLWLDESMSYSCAYFHSEEDTLEQAQLQKIDHVLRKLQLKPGERLLDIGSGWGWLLIRAAQQYGVLAKGITLSEEQYKKSLERIRQLGLQDQVEVELIDYRQLSSREQRFDRIASVGMFEHVGRDHYPVFMSTIGQLLKPSGLALLHTITHQTEEPADPWIEKYIFPGGYIPSIREIVSLLPEYQFHLLDVENLRMHYAKTLDMWAERFEQNVNRVQEMYGDRFVRMWRLYLQSSAATFRYGGISIHQFLFSKGVNNDLFLTREHLYR